MFTTKETTDELFVAEVGQVAEFQKMFTEKALGRLKYNLEENLPKGIMTLEQIKGDSVKSGLVSSIGTFIKWDIYQAMELCADILEDVNAHKEAQVLRVMLAEAQ